MKRWNIQKKQAMNHCQTKTGQAEKIGKGALSDRIGKIILVILLSLLTLIMLLVLTGTVAQAAGLVDDTVDAANEYSRYPLRNYQLDFYVDTSWDWLPWNWTDGIGKQVMYGLYAITNFIWTISLYLSNAAGYLVKEAYSLDFVSNTADAIGKNIQTLAGVSPSGFSTDGFYPGFLLILILILGVYVTYTGLIKRETTKAVHALVNFGVVFLVSASCIAYAPDLIQKVNDFSSDISNASLSLGTKILLPDSDSQGKDSVDLIRDSLFAIQVKQPWLLLEFDQSDVESIGEDRVEALLSADPDADKGKTREDVVKTEIEDRDNANLTVTKVISRLGTVFFLFLFNIGISIFVFLLTGIMLFSQVLFILYAMFLPVSFLISMVPGFDATAKRAVMKLFNTILTRAGITLIVTVAFSISSMLYHLTGTFPFFLTAFLQVVTFAGIYFKLGDLMRMFSLQANDSQSMGQRIMRRPRMLLAAHMHHMQHKISRSLSGSKAQQNKPAERTAAGARAQADHTRPNETSGTAGTDDRSASAARSNRTAFYTENPVGSGMTNQNTVRDADAYKNPEKEPSLQAAAPYRKTAGFAAGAQGFTTETGGARDSRRGTGQAKPETHRRTVAERRKERETWPESRPPQNVPGTMLHERPAAIRQNRSEQETVSTVPVAESNIAMPQERSFTGSHAERPNTHKVSKPESTTFDREKSNQSAQATKPSETGFSGMEHSSSGRHEREIFRENLKEESFPPGTARPGTVILNGKEIRMEEIKKEESWAKEEPRKLIPRSVRRPERRTSDRSGRKRL